MIKQFCTAATLALALIAAPALADNHGKNIIETAADAGQFGTLLTAIETAGLTGALSGEGPFTVFAPTDEAFAAIPAKDLEAILADTDLLTSILTYHVVSGKVMAADVVNLSSATTLQGSDVSISVDGGTVSVDDATVVATDIETSNGVIHVIDAVITP
ncbi:MAG: fasciclin domain-containing protein [Wenzhouxiangella sp.]|jgi:uncharacterized surface protein with fasciclin (FAS1) repeats|nr:fasciclin domain-containing protein [Wenzhouxiangella sp.]